MGAYLSEPIVEKESVDELGKYVNCGASSMQGWRVTQEDAHNCLLEFEPETAFFAVYDGHGGNEVAVYCAGNFPEFLKDCESFKKGDFEEALKEAFLGFDAKLATPEVVAVLKDIAGKKDMDSEDDEENVRNLFEEAEMPLEQVMAKYRTDRGQLVGLNEGAGVAGPSPAIRGKRACTAVKQVSSSSGSGCSSNRVIDFEPSAEVNGSCDAMVGSSDSAVGSSKEGSEKVDASEATEAEAKAGTEANGCLDEKPVVLENGILEPDCSVDAKKGIVEEVASPVKEAVTPVKKPLANGEVGASDANGKLENEAQAVDGVSSSVANGDHAKTADSAATASPGYVGKGKGKARLPSPAEKAAQAKHVMALRRATASALYKSLLEAQGSDSSDSESDADETFEGAAEVSSDDDAEGEGEETTGQADEEGDEEDEDEDDDDDSADEEDDEEDEDFGMKMTEEPGFDSGCTAVVALLRGTELYVANAGDSRCVVCREGQAVEMSLDHKPEDQTELDRILKAGGKVTEDGRVNGGLNLSRALGDHAYKLNTALPASAQMITALPDVRRLAIAPAQDEFMVLACDGIWNFMSSQEVVDFVRPRIADCADKLSTICEELFDHCLAPDTMGDGTGCDNMTCVIVKFHPTLGTVVESGSAAAKRPASPAAEELCATKRTKTEDPAPTPVDPAPIVPALV